MTDLFAKRLEHLNSASPTLDIDIASMDEDLVAFGKFVKGKEKNAGKHGDDGLLPCISYSMRSVAIYISDAVEAFSMLPQVTAMAGAIEIGTQVRFLQFADAIMDSARFSGSGTAEKAIHDFQKLGPYRREHETATKGLLQQTLLI